MNSNKLFIAEELSRTPYFPPGNGVPQGQLNIIEKSQTDSPHWENTTGWLPALVVKQSGGDRALVKSVGDEDNYLRHVPSTNIALSHNSQHNNQQGLDNTSNHSLSAGEYVWCWQGLIF